MFATKKFIVILSLFFLVSSTDAMITEFLPETFFGYSYTKQHTEQTNLDRELWKAIRAFPAGWSERDFKQIKEWLNKGANLNSSASGETSLTWVISNLNTDLLKFLIQLGADINLKNSLGHTPLGCSIFYSAGLRECSGIEILCDSGVSLLNLIDFYPGANAFHHAVRLGGSKAKKIIQILMTHARFDSYAQDQNQKERRVLATLSVLSGLPKEIRFRILEELTLVDDDYCSNKKLCKQLLSKNRTSPVFIQISRRVENLTKILDSKDDTLKQTPLEWVDSFSQVIWAQDKEKIRALLKKEKLQKNWDDFNDKFPDILKSDPNNPVCGMYNNCVKLLGK